MYDLFASQHTSFQLEDGAGATKVLPRTNGARGFGTRTPKNRERVDILEDGLQVGSVYGDEQGREVSVSVNWDSAAADVVDFCLARGAYAVGGTSPMVTVDPVGEVAATKLIAIFRPPKGTAFKRTYERAYLQIDETADRPATMTLTWTVFGTEVETPV